MIVQYVRNEKKQPIGVVVAKDKDKIGWSLWNNKKIYITNNFAICDKWDKNFGKNLAMKRANVNLDHWIKYFEREGALKKGTKVTKYLIPTMKYVMKRMEKRK